MGKSLHSRQHEAQVKILVIDDEAAAIRVLTYLLERSGYQGISTQSAKDAFFLLHETPADLIIADIFRPDINSLEVLTRLKKLSRHSHPRGLWRLQYRGQEPLGTGARKRRRCYLSHPLQSRRLHRNHHRSARLNTLLANPSSDRYTPNTQAAPFTERPQLQCHSTRWSNPIRETWKNPSALKRRYTL
ncbi:MAG: response regulator [Gemmatimonadetes bacterium]|jgi:PleD family two-component response regulator|nr:response regulator [Gemmatimonadota bacterium]